MFTQRTANETVLGNFFSNPSSLSAPTSCNVVSRKFKSNMFLSSSFYNLNNKYSLGIFNSSSRTVYFPVVNLQHVWWVNNAIISTSFSQRSRVSKFRVVQTSVFF